MMRGEVPGKALLRAGVDLSTPQSCPTHGHNPTCGAGGGTKPRDKTPRNTGNTSCFPALEKGHWKEAGTLSKTAVPGSVCRAARQAGRPSLSISAAGC